MADAKRLHSHAFYLQIEIIKNRYGDYRHKKKETGKA